MKISRLSLFSFAILFVGCATSSKLISTNQYPFSNKSILLIPTITDISILKNKKESENKDEIAALNEEVGMNVLQITDSFFMRHRIKLDKYQYDEVDDYLPIKEVLEYHTKLTKSKSGNPMNYSKYNLKKIFDSIKVSDNLCDYIKEKKNRFAISVLTVGFTRTQINNKSRKVDNVAKTLIFGAGAYGPTTGGWRIQDEFFVQTYFFLIDADKKQLAMFHTKSDIFEPRNKELLQGLVNAGLSEFWK
jgi:hypothetical protein